MSIIVAIREAKEINVVENCIERLYVDNSGAWT